MVETEGMLNTRTGEYDFIGRSIPIFPQNDLDVPAGEKAYIKVKAPFCDKLSGMICTKFFGRNMVYTLRVKFQDNQGVVQFRNGSDEIAQLRKDKAVAQIMKAKTEPATTRIMRLLDRLSAYSFNLYYVKGRDMILSDYLRRHRQKDLDPSELIPISFCCLRTYRSIIDDKIGEEIFCVKKRAIAKASGETVGEVHGADKPLDPNYKPEHQSKSKLPSMTRKSSPEKIVRKPILQTPARHTHRRVATPKSVRIQSEVASDMTAPDSDPTPIRTPVMVHGGARPKTPIMKALP